jgi:hypothetical protein
MAPAYPLSRPPHRHRSKLPICAGRKALIVAIEMVNDQGAFKSELTRASTTDEMITDAGNAAHDAFMTLDRTETLELRLRRIMLPMQGHTQVVLSFGHLARRIRHPQRSKPTEEDPGLRPIGAKRSGLFSRSCAGLTRASIFFARDS